MATKKSEVVEVVGSEENYLASKWWIFTIQGILAILFGIACVFWPGITLATFVYLFGIWLLLGGVLSMVHGLVSIGRRKAWILTLLFGLLEIGVGVFLLRNPLVSFGLLILLIGFILVFYAVFEIVSALADSESSSTHKMLSIIGGIIAGLAGIFIFFQPAAGGVAFVWIIGLFSLINGPIWIALSMDVKRIADQQKAKA
jgi:uncharacterized membrane protein HdeD (DUF308 family)